MESIARLEHSSYGRLLTLLQTTSKVSVQLWLAAVLYAMDCIFKDELLQFTISSVWLARAVFRLVSRMAKAYRSQAA